METMDPRSTFAKPPDLIPAAAAKSRTLALTKDVVVGEVILLAKEVATSANAFHSELLSRMSTLDPTEIELFECTK